LKRVFHPSAGGSGTYVVLCGDFFEAFAGNKAADCGVNCLLAKEARRNRHLNTKDKSPRMMEVTQRELDNQASPR